MENIKLGIFDLFGHILPGLILFFAIYIPFDSNLSDFKTILILIQTLNTSSIIVIVLISYILSNVLHQIGYLWFKYFGKRIWKSNSKTLGEEKLKNKDYSMLHTLIRQYSPNNTKFIEEWAAKRAMAFNLSLGFLFLTISSIIKLFQIQYKEDWIILMIGSLISSCLILIKARAYHDWYHDDIYSTIKTIEMEKNITFSQIIDKEI